MTDKPGLTGASLLSAGDVVANRYRVIEELGRGGYAIVYRAEDTRTGETIALKTIRPIAPRPDEVRERFRREVEVVSKLKHHNTVRVFDYGVETDFFLAMELLEGSPLSDLLDGHTGLDLTRSINITRGVLASLTEAHRLGIVHRDLKPENVFSVRRSQDDVEQVKVLDFGIAKALLDDKSPQLTLKGRAMGTPAYMSPEQAKGAELTVHSDLYAVAVLFYEMVCGVPPFSGDSAMSIMLKHVNEPAPQLTVRSLQGTALEKVILKALAKNPFDRFSSAEEFDAALAAAAAQLGGVGQPDDQSTAPRPVAPAQTPESSATPSDSAAQPTKRDNLFASWFKRR